MADEMSEEEREVLGRLEEDDGWYRENQDWIKEKHDGKYVVVANKGIIYAGTSRRDAGKKMLEHEIASMYTIGFCERQEYEMGMGLYDFNMKMILI